MDISSEMVINLLPLFLSSVLGIRTSIIGLIEGVAEATASILKMFSGWFSDRLKSRKWLAVAGYILSAISKPLFYVADTWGFVAGIRWMDRIGKGVRTAPRDALVADSINPEMRGLAFGFHRAADTAGAMFGIGIAMLVVWYMQSSSSLLQLATFKTIVLFSILPALMAVLILIIGTKDTHVGNGQPVPRLSFRSLGRPFLKFMVIMAVFDLGNSSDAFLVLRAQERGVSVTGILGMLLVFNFVYTLVSIPAGSLSDRLGRRKMIIGGWLVYAAIYLGFGFAQQAWLVWLLYVIHGVYYGMTYGTSKAMIADLVPVHLRGTAYGNYNAILGILDFPASLIAGILWQGLGGWKGFGAPAPFIFGGCMALLAVILFLTWKPEKQLEHPN